MADRISENETVTVGKLIEILKKYDPDSRINICVYVPEENLFASIEGLTMTQNGVTIYGMEGF